MAPVDIGDTQGTLQAKKTFETLYKRPETLVWVYISFWCSVQSQLTGVKSHIFSLCFDFRPFSILYLLFMIHSIFVIIFLSIFLFLSDSDSVRLFLSLSVCLSRFSSLCLFLIFPSLCTLSLPSSPCISLYPSQWHYPVSPYMSPFTLCHVFMIDVRVRVRFTHHNVPVYWRQITATNCHLFS